MNRFLIVSIVSGVIFGIGIGALDDLLYDDNWLGTVLVGLFSGLLFGLFLGFIARILSHIKTASCLRHLLTAFSFTVAGLLLGIVLFIGINELPHGQWGQVMPPPEKPVLVLGQSAFTYWGGSIFIESEEGNIFSYMCDTENPCKWNKEEFPPIKPEETLWSCPPDYKGSYIAPTILFGKIVDSYEVNICGVDYTNQINLVILEDGTIWVWNRFSSAIERGFIFPIWLAVSLGASLMGYFASLIGRKKNQV